MEKSIRILLVDDEEDILEALSFNLEANGFRVSTAGSGNQAFELFQKREFDAVVTDIKMPDGNGVELLKNIKRVRPLFPVVSFVTGYSNLSLQDAYHLGASSTFPKPFKFEDLKNKIEWSVMPVDLKWSKPLEDEVSGEIQSRGECTLGSGGACIEVQVESQLKIGSVISFNIESPVGPVVGKGWVRWISDAEKMMGLEFGFLETQCRENVKKYIFDKKPVPYIPKEKES